ncbi:MAG: hypothetical protein ACM3O3_04575 [Syntrophothermus sp.]|nr:hypothetical protein [Ignavibacteriaceae bacterium]
MFGKKVLLWFSSVLLLLSITMITGCKKDDNNPTGPGGGGGGGNNAITINGAGFSNAGMTVVASYSAFVTTENLTYVNLMGSFTSDTAFVVVAFPGQNGTSTWDGLSTGAYLVLYGTSRFFTAMPNSGTTTVTSYGAVGTAIGGSINGTLYDTQGDSLKISGNFSATRLPDQDSIGGPIKLNNLQIRTF